MKAMRTILEDFLASSTPDQLRAELTKGNRPHFQTLEDPEWICANEPALALPATMPASVSFFEGEFAPDDQATEEWRGTMAAAANEECALAA